VSTPEGAWAGASREGPRGSEPCPPSSPWSGETWRGRASPPLPPPHTSLSGAPALSLRPPTASAQSPGGQGQDPTRPCQLSGWGVGAEAAVRAPGGPAPRRRARCRRPAPLRWRQLSSWGRRAPPALAAANPSSRVCLAKKAQAQGSVSSLSWLSGPSPPRSPELPPGVPSPADRKLRGSSSPRTSSQAARGPAPLRWGVSEPPAHRGGPSPRGPCLRGSWDPSPSPALGSPLVSLPRGLTGGTLLVRLSQSATLRANLFRLLLAYFLGRSFSLASLQQHSGRQPPPPTACPGTPLPRPVRPSPDEHRCQAVDHKHSCLHFLWI